MAVLVSADRVVVDAAAIRARYGSSIRSEITDTTGAMTESSLDTTYI
jgi:hypothetical protein